MTTVTDGSTRQVASTQNRNGPDLQCACCYHMAPRDQPVYLASFVSSIWTWHRPVCADCWDKGRATKPDNPLHSSITAICRATEAKPTARTFVSSSAAACSHRCRAAGVTDRSSRGAVRRR